MVIDPEDPPLRPERHVPNSIATMRRRLAAAIVRRLSRCPCCARAITPTQRRRNLEGGERTRRNTKATGERSDAVLRTATGERSNAVLRTATGERSDAVLRTAIEQAGMHGPRPSRRASSKRSSDPMGGGWSGEARIRICANHASLGGSSCSKLDRTETAATVEHATVYLAFELSKAKWKLGVHVTGFAAAEPLHERGRRLGASGYPPSGHAARGLPQRPDGCGYCHATRQGLMDTGCIGG